MARLPRNQLDGLFHHVTGRGTGGAHLFCDDEDRRYFASVARRAIDRFEIVCHAWCALGTHFHLLLEARVEAMSGAMHRLGTAYAMYYNERYGRRGRLFENRFSSWVVRDEAHLHAASDYILHNPVRAGLCSIPEEWLWCGLGAPPAGIAATRPSP